MGFTCLAHDYSMAILATPERAGWCPFQVKFRSPQLGPAPSNRALNSLINILITHPSKPIGRTAVPLTLNSSKKQRLTGTAYRANRSHLLVAHSRELE